MQPKDLPALAMAAFNSRDPDGLRALWTDDFHFIGPDAESHGADVMVAREHGLWTAFPDVQATIELVSAGPDVLAMQTTMTGTHTGPFDLGGRTLAPTGRPISLSFGVHLWFRDGLACRERVYYDRMGLLQQLGVVDA